ncbi:hypothetical protein SAMN05428949_2769 [Chitinophaga sp. YR627]|uniref:hypothetical protein n=1 Tax=Chitinophaga sp. YR627 TaxID=1881041 RepID=UPI0008EA4197|nr:hypothetical protein [Chitinophaga sp. YR627]SFN41887.1 hypothetical protein SAMN05428949_2769 [Chitinophaga sp. YR627]
MTTYFSAEQRRILRYSWIPVIIFLCCFLWSDLLSLHPEINDSTTNYLSSLLLRLPLALLPAYEFFIRRRYRDMIFMILLAVISVVIMLWEFYQRVHAGPILYGFSTLAISLGCSFIILSLRAWLLGLKNIWFTTLLAVSATCFAQSIFTQIDLFTEGKDLPFYIQELITLPFKIVLPVLYFTVLFLADNVTEYSNYWPKLQSRLQVINGKEYLLLSLCGIYAGFFGAVALGWSLMIVYVKMRGVSLLNMDYFSVSVLVIRSLIFLVGCLLKGYLFRNIVISRMMTTGRKDAWWFVLHYLLPVNILAVILLAGKKTIHTTTGENLQCYLSERKSSVGTVLIYAGCIGRLLIVGVFGILLFQWPDLNAGIAVAFIFCCALLYPFLRRHRAVFIAITVLNATLLCFYAAADYDSSFALFFMIVYQYIFVFQEVFYPTLDSMEGGEEQLLFVG